MPQGPQTHTYPIPLPDFDPLAARPDQLALYGLPARPDPRLEQELFLFWAQLLGPPTTFIVPQFSRPGSSNLEVQSNLDAGRAMLRTGPPHRRFLSHQNSKNWSGVYITPSPRPNRFVQMTGGWTVPQPAVPGVPVGWRRLGLVAVVAVAGSGGSVAGLARLQV